MKTFRREIHPEIRVIDEKNGTVEYIASNQTLDSYNEIVLADGARFNRLAKNAPFVDSHQYDSIDNLLGRIVDFKVTGKQVIETVKWAIDVPTNIAAIKGFAMTAAGYLKAVSIGFMPTRVFTKWDNDPNPFMECLKELGVQAGTDVRVIYKEWEQIELSACVIGANPDAVARAYKAGILDDAWLERISTQKAKSEIADSTDSPAAVESARRRAQTALIVELQTAINRI